MQIVKAINAGLAFFLELAMLAAFGYAGFNSNTGTGVRWALGLGVPVVAAIVWGVFFAPRAARRLSAPAGIFVSLALFCAAAVALMLVGQTGLGIVLALIAVVNRLLVLVWKQW
jgi:hypothetical protein